MNLNKENQTLNQTRSTINQCLSQRKPPSECDGFLSIRMNMIRLIFHNRFNNFPHWGRLLITSYSPHAVRLIPITKGSGYCWLVQPLIRLLNQHPPIGLHCLNLDRFTQKSSQFMVDEGCNSKNPINDDSNMSRQKSVAPVLQAVEISCKNIFMCLFICILISCQLQCFSDTTLSIKADGFQLMTSTLFGCVCSPSDDLKRCCPSLISLIPNKIEQAFASFNNLVCNFCLPCLRFQWETSHLYLFLDLQAVACGIDS